jgi:hypothetical protein
VLSEIPKYLPKCATAVLVAYDREEYPYNIRIRPLVTGEVIRFTMPGYQPVGPGPASILAHSHDDNASNLTSLGIKGILEKDDQGWFLLPTHFIPGTGNGSDPFKMISGARAAAKKYLADRNLTPPRIEWEKIRALNASLRK